MTGRSLHDALLVALTSASFRERLSRAGRSPAGETEETTVLRGADPDRLRRLARFFGRHFYRERLVRLFVASRRLAREAGPDPLAVLGSAAFGAILEQAELGSSATADAVATLIEAELAGPLRGRPGGQALSAYEGALFRVEAGPRRWGASPARGTVAVRAASTRILALDWDVVPVVIAARRGDAVLPVPASTPTRLLIALAPEGRVATVRATERIERLLALLDGGRSPAAVAHELGLEPSELDRVLDQLVLLGAVEWRPEAGPA